MELNQFIKNLSVPKGKIDVVLDTDAYNEVDDQFAISYMISNQDKLNIKGFTAAPFFNQLSTSPSDGMHKSYDELIKLLIFANEEELSKKVYRGSEGYLPNENTPVESPAANFLAELANEYSAKKPLYIVAIGAITNVASAFIKNPSMKEKTVVVWLGGHAHHMPHTAEFNMVQDVAAARVILNSGVPFVQLPCWGVVDRFNVSKYELLHYFDGKNKLCDYLRDHTIEIADKDANGALWGRVLWDVTAVAWLLNDNSRFMDDSLVHTPFVSYDSKYSFDDARHFMRYVYNIKREALLSDMIEKLTSRK